MDERNRRIFESPNTYSSVQFFVDKLAFWNLLTIYSVLHWVNPYPSILCKTTFIARSKVAYAVEECSIVWCGCIKPILDYSKKLYNISRSIIASIFQVREKHFQLRHANICLDLPTFYFVARGGIISYYLSFVDFLNLSEPRQHSSK